MVRKVSIAACVLACLPGVSARAQAFPFEGPVHGMTFREGDSPAGELFVWGGVRFHGGSGGLYRTTDGGSTWLRAHGDIPESPEVFVTAFALDPTEPTRMLCAVESVGVLQSTDGGAHWVRVIPNVTAWDLAFEAPAAAGEAPLAYAALEGLGVRRSLDGGTTWEPSVNGMAGVNVSDVAVSPTNPNHLYVSWRGLNAGGAFGTQNGGVTWSDITPANQRYVSVAVSPFDPALVFLASDGPWDDARLPGVYASDDFGESWVNPWVDRPRPLTVVASPFDRATAFMGGSIWATRQAKIWRTSSTGTAWTTFYGGDAVSEGFPVSIADLALHPTDPDVMYAIASMYGDRVLGVLATTNGGSSWQVRNTGIENLDLASIAIDPTNPSVLYAGARCFSILGEPPVTCGDGNVDPGEDCDDANRAWGDGCNQRCVLESETACGDGFWDGAGPDVTTWCREDCLYRSDDAGLTWSAVMRSAAQRQVNDLLVDEAGRLWLAADPLLLTSDDLGATYIDEDPEDALPSGSLHRKLQLARAGGETFVAVENGGVFVQRDGDWRALGPVGDDMLDLTLSRTGGPLALAEMSLYQSADSGLNWVSREPAEEIVIGKSIEADPDEGRIVLLSDVLHTWRSTDGGATFAVIDVGGTEPGFDKYSVFAFNPADPLEVFAGRDNNAAGTPFPHVFRSTNAGATWEVRSTGLSAGDTVRVAGIAFDPRHPGWAYLVESFNPIHGGANRLWVTHDSGITWTPPLALPKSIAVASDDALTLEPGETASIELELLDTRGEPVAASAHLIAVAPPALGTTTAPAELGGGIYVVEYAAGAAPGVETLVALCEECTDVREATVNITIASAPTGGDGGVGDGGRTEDGAGRDRDAGGSHAGPPTPPEGCGCRVAGRRSLPMRDALTALALAALLTARRRRSGPGGPRAR